MSWTHDHHIRDFGSEEITLSDPAVKVGVDQFGLISRESGEALVYTMDADVCAGVAIFLNQIAGQAGVMHILSDPSFHGHGEKAVRAHAQRCWDMLAENLDPQALFGAILFGGKSAFPGKESPGTITSGWLGEGLRRAVETAPNIEIVRNFQYDNGPHDAFVRLGERHVFVQASRAQPIVVETPDHAQRSGVALPKFIP